MVSTKCSYHEIEIGREYRDDLIVDISKDYIVPFTITLMCKKCRETINIKLNV